VQYISDAERFFEDSQYLAEVLDTAAREPQRPTLTSPSRTDETWRLIVAEDADNFLRANARERAGAALGRILNLSDGIHGQDHRVLFLLTTNEEVSRLHPALVRPGRCLANTAFSRFPVAQARKWLDGSGSVTQPMTLAELLAMRGDIRAAATDSSSPETFIGAYL